MTSGSSPRLASAASLGADWQIRKHVSQHVRYYILNHNRSYRSSVFVQPIVLYLTLGSPFVSLLVCFRGTPERSYVLPVYHQAYGNQPYPRSAQSQAMSITLGTAAKKVSYKFTVDTGSGVLLATCRSPTSLANCNNDLPANRNYEMSPATTVSDAATCTSTGIGCMLSSNTCFLSEQVRLFNSV